MRESLYLACSAKCEKNRLCASCPFALNNVQKYLNIKDVKVEPRGYDSRELSVIKDNRITHVVTAGFITRKS